MAIPKTLVIDRRSMVDGTLYDKDRGQMCMLGQLAHHAGIPSGFLHHHGAYHTVANSIERSTVLSEKDKKKYLAIMSELKGLLGEDGQTNTVATNDDRTEPWEVREERLTRLYKSIGVELVFIGEYGPYNDSANRIPSELYEVLAEQIQHREEGLGQRQKSKPKPEKRGGPIW